MNCEIILFDAANTLIYKPDLWINFIEVLNKNGIRVDENELKKKHKLVSEIIEFPDKTSRAFYKKFNYEVLLTLGIIADNQLLTEIFEACSYLPWKPFSDTNILASFAQQKVILSNFNTSLKTKIHSIFGEQLFENIIISEDEGVRKPEIKFYKRAIEIIGVEPSKILYIGDSLKLDIIPAKSIDMNAWLIDRDKNFKYFDHRIDSLTNIKKLLS